MGRLLRGFWTTLQVKGRRSEPLSFLLPFFSSRNKKLTPWNVKKLLPYELNRAGKGTGWVLPLAGGHYYLGLGSCRATGLCPGRLWRSARPVIRAPTSTRSYSPGGGGRNRPLTAPSAAAAAARPCGARTPVPARLPFPGDATAERCTTGPGAGLRSGPSPGDVAWREEVPAHWLGFPPHLIPSLLSSHWALRRSPANRRPQPREGPAPGQPLGGGSGRHVGVSGGRYSR